MNLSKLTKKELYEQAAKRDIAGRSKMTKKELIEALEPYFSQAPSSSDKVGYGEAEKTEAPPMVPDYPIPDYYQVDTIVFMPINPRREYVYWELSEKTLKNLSDKLGSEHLTVVLKIYQSEAEKKELASIKVGRYGNWYFDFYSPDEVMWAELGIMDDKGNYHAVVSSRKVKMPSDKLSGVDEETWMTVGEKIEEIMKLSGVEDIDKQDMPGSVRMHLEIMKLLEKNKSSTSFIKGDE